MKLIEFHEQTAIIAKNQPEYLPLPANISPEGIVTCCWELSDDDVAQIIKTRKIWHQILTFKKPLQPQLLLTEKPDFLIK